MATLPFIFHSLPSWFCSLPSKRCQSKYPLVWMFATHFKLNNLLYQLKFGEIEGIFGGGKKPITATKNLNLTFGAKPKNPVNL